VIWSHAIPDKDELGDCTMLSNGHVVFSRKSQGAERSSPILPPAWGGKIVGGTRRIPSTRGAHRPPVGTDKVLVMQNGTPPS
jgi:hypothetical protein